MGARRKTPAWCIVEITHPCRTQGPAVCSVKLDGISTIVIESFAAVVKGGLQHLRIDQLGFVLSFRPIPIACAALALGIF